MRASDGKQGINKFWPIMEPNYWYVVIWLKSRQIFYIPSHQLTFVDVVTRHFAQDQTDAVCNLPSLYKVGRPANICSGYLMLCREFELLVLLEAL